MGVSFKDAVDAKRARQLLSEIRSQVARLAALPDDKLCWMVDDIVKVAEWLPSGLDPKMLDGDGLLEKSFDGPYEIRLGPPVV